MGADLGASGTCQGKPPGIASPTPGADAKMRDLRRHFGLETDLEVLHRITSLEFPTYDPEDPFWGKAVRHDLVRWERDGVLPPYVIRRHADVVSAAGK